MTSSARRFLLFLVAFLNTRKAFSSTHSRSFLLALLAGTLSLFTAAAASGVDRPGKVSFGLAGTGDPSISVPLPETVEWQQFQPDASLEARVTDPDVKTRGNVVPPAEVTWKWYRGDGNTPISGATMSTYTVKAADVGHSITVRATYDDGNGPKTVRYTSPNPVQAKRNPTSNGIPAFPTSIVKIWVYDNRDNIGNPITATDPDGDILTYTLRQSPDSGVGHDDGVPRYDNVPRRFTIDNATGQLRLIPGVDLDYDTPRDDNKDNVYEFKVRAYDSSANNSGAQTNPQVVVETSVRIYVVTDLAATGVWCTTLTVHDFNNARGCANGATVSTNIPTGSGIPGDFKQKDKEEAYCFSALTKKAFRYKGENYEIRRIQSFATSPPNFKFAEFYLWLNNQVPDDMVGNMPKLCLLVDGDPKWCDVDDVDFVIPGTPTPDKDGVYWGDGFNWEVGQEVSLELRLSENKDDPSTCTASTSGGGSGTPTGGGGGGGTPTGGGGGTEGGGPTTPALSGDAALGSLGIEEASLDFDPDTYTYTADVPYDVTSVTLTPTANHEDAEITINGERVESGEETSIDLDDEGETVITIEVTAEDGTIRTYTLTVMSCPREDRKTLEKFYEATGGENWHENENWNSEEPLGEWHGVETDEDGSVVSLLLPDNNLSGDMPTEELRCLKDKELVELALWDNDGLSGEAPQKLTLAVERAALREIAEILNLNPQWFNTYEDPYNFNDWHGGVTTDDDGRVTELDFRDGEEIEGTVPAVVLEQLGRLGTLYLNCTISVEGDAPEGVNVVEEVCEEPGGGGCALSSGSGDFPAFGLFLVTLLVFAALGRTRAR